VTINGDRGALGAGPMGPLVLLSRDVYLIGLVALGATRRALPGLPVAVGPYTGRRPARTVTPYREERCLPMPRYARLGRS